jgi:hypothetical protein
LDDAQFWNPKIRAPICFNPAAARSVLTGYLARTDWVLVGVSRSGMIARTKAALAASTLLTPEPGAICYMMSKQGHLSDADGHWHPHLMFFLAHTDGAAWGADLDCPPYCRTGRSGARHDVFRSGDQMVRRNTRGHGNALRVSRA